MRQIALDQNLNHAVDKIEVARYMYGRPLDFTPATNYKYSNFGYVLASIVVEQITGVKFFDFVKTNLLQPYNRS